MDDLGNHYTLEQLNNERQHSLFLSSRVYIFIHIARALCGLADHGVAHLDLSSNNVCIGKDLLIKIIDFGEAYHPLICESGYRPGITFPTCPPESASAHP